MSRSAWNFVQLFLTRYASHVQAIDKYHQKYTAERETPSITIPDLASVR